MNEHEMCCGTVADKAKLCAEIAERDRVIDEQQQRIEELLQERDGAAAQLERLRVASAEIAWAWLVDYGDNDGVYQDLMDALSEQAPAALAALKAQWQAEAVRDFEAMLSSFPVTAEDWIEQRTQETNNATNP